MFRNRFKEEVLSGRVSLPEGRTLDSLTSEPDALLIVDKQRNGESWVGHIRLWWNQDELNRLGAEIDPLNPFIIFLHADITVVQKILANKLKRDGFNGKPGFIDRFVPNLEIYHDRKELLPLVDKLSQHYGKDPKEITRLTEERKWRELICYLVGVNNLKESL